MQAEASLSLDDSSVVRLQHTGAHVILNERLFLGPANSATNEAAVTSDDISHIINVTKEISLQQFSGVKVCHFECYDSPQQHLPFKEAVAFIDQCWDEGGTCLVHCNAGQSRSASIILYYLMSKGFTLKESYDYVKKRKPDIRPNFGFCSQLQNAEVTLFGKSSLDMNEYKADTLCDILEGSGKTREDVLRALEKWGGNGEIALGMLLEG
mmetsp:Transcript_39231/g.66878  ORF Transcript_39231/g.66878 Transcript_39231/m.66878 type:complete len:210 (+) Transcript_39231:278-907(+)